MKIVLDTYWEHIKDITFQALKQLSDIDREMFIQEYREKYCIDCGSTNPRCQCWNDD
jgi:hypothetical protein